MKTITKIQFQKQLDNINLFANNSKKVVFQQFENKQINKNEMSRKLKDIEKNTTEKTRELFKIPVTKDI